MKKKEKIVEIQEDKFYTNLYYLFFSLLPFIYSDLLIDPVLLPRQLFLTLFLLVLILKIGFQKEKLFLFSNQLFKNTVIFSILGFSIITILSTLFSFNISESVYVSSKYFVEFVYLMVTFILLINKKITFKTLQKSIIFLTSILVLITFFQFMKCYGNGENLIDNDKITATIANKNLVSSLFYLTIPFIISLLYDPSYNKIWKTISFLNFISVLIIIYFLQTKTVFISTIAFVMSFLFLNTIIKFYRKLKFNFSKSTISIISLLVLFSFFYGVNLIDKQKIVQFNTIKKSENKIDHSLNTPKKTDFIKVNSVHTFDLRLSLWNNTIKMFKDHPLLGVGPGNWQIFFPKYGLNNIDEKSTKDGYTTYQRPHNDWLWIASELGIFGLIFYILIIFFSIIYIIKNSINEQRSSIQITNLLFASAIIGYLFVYLADFPLERIEHQILIFTIIAYILFYNFSKFSFDIQINKNNKFYFLLISFLVCIYSLIISFSRLSSEKHTRFLKVAHIQSDWNNMLFEADIARSSFYTLDPMSIPLDWYKGVAFYSLNDFPSALISFQNAYRTHPYNIHIINDLASTFEKLKNHNKAVTYYKKALSISSGFDEARLNLCAVYFNKKKYKAAFLELKKCDSTTINSKYKLFIPSVTKKYLNLNNLTDTSLFKIFHNFKPNINFKNF
jgi:O-antigen ligase